MPIFRYILCTLLICFSLNVQSIQSNCQSACDGCCAGKYGGISYCDSSAGRYVCKNGEYSVCYCTRHAVMDLQKIEGCCLWQGGVFRVTETGIVVCNNGGISEICGLQSPVDNNLPKF